MSEKNRKAKIGRPSLGKDARQIPVLIRVSVNEKTAWTKAAKAEGMSLGAWLLKPRRDELGKGV